MSNPQAEEAFISLVRRHERLIYKVCSLYISPDWPLPDLYQEVVYNLWKAFPKFRGESAFSTWIYRIALNTCISGLRAGTRRPAQVSLDLWRETGFEPDNSDEEIRRMHELIRRLRTLDRAIVLLYLEEKNYREIGEIMGLSENNVGVRMTRIREKLRKMSNE